MTLYCIECEKPASEVEHGTPPVFSDHHYISISELCASLGHLTLSGRVGDWCVRCGTAREAE